MRASNDSKWARETLGAIEEHLVQKGREQAGFEASLWDLFELRPQDCWESRGPEVAQVVCSLNALSARKLSKWIKDNKEEAIKGYTARDYIGEYYRYGDVAATVQNVTNFKSLPPNMPFFGPEVDKSPIKGVAMRADGEKWDLMLPLKISSLIRHPRYFSERDMAKILCIKRSNLKRILDNAADVGFPLDKPLKNIPHHTLEYIVFGKRPRRKPHS